MCHLILDSIRNHYVLISNKKNVLDDWDYLDDFSDAADNDELSEIDDNEWFLEVYERHQKFFHEAECAPSDSLHDPNSPIILEFVFRDPRRDEVAGRCTDINVHWTQTGELARLHTSALSLVSQLPDDLVALCESRDLQNDTGTESPYSTALTQLWLKKCDAEHELCRKRKEQREILLPTRVIDVSSRGLPFLVQSQKAQTADYVCLSHCWGKSQPFKTEMNSLAKRMSGMDVRTMPQTFQDAIAITRNLGIKFLWIDSLCIIQDSSEDWARESAQMGRIYRDATITIFAEHADGDDGGCFSLRSGRASALCRTEMFDPLVGFFSKEGSHTPLAMVQAKLHHAGGHSLPERHSIFETVKALNSRQTGPLNSRAWVLQESILSHRALLYDEHEVRWSCPTMKACECIPEGQVRRSWSRLDKGDPDIVDTRELANAWSAIVRDFSRRGLTYSKDKLPALAGIASEMLQYKRSTYLAGLWKDDLQTNLAWSVHPRGVGAPYRGTTRIKNSHTPSWSWAKVEGEVRMLNHSYDITNFTDARSTRAKSLVGEIVECNTTPANDLNPFGEVSSGVLILRGRLGQAKCCSPVTTSHHIDRIPLQDSKSNLKMAWFDPDISPIPKEAPIDSVWSIPTVYSNSDSLYCLGLILVSADRAEKTRLEHPWVEGRIFERVGIVSAMPILSRTFETDNTVTATTGEPTKHSSPETDQDSGFFNWLEHCEVSTITVI